MIKEAYCSYVIAKLLKEKGFDWKTQHSYNSKGKFGWSDNLDPYEYPAPTHQMACAWLRGKGIHVAVLYQSKFKSWERIIQSSTGVEWSVGGFSSHDEAIESALKYTLENLI